MKILFPGRRSRFLGRWLLSFGLIFLMACEHKKLEEALHLYQGGQYPEALKIYREGLRKDSHSDIFNYNAGTVLYKMGDYPKAIEHFTRALVTEMAVLEAKAIYNIGNCKYREGEQRERTDPGAAVELYKESLDYYKRAMELNGKDEEASYNHQVVEKKLASLLTPLDKQREEKKSEDQESKQKETPLPEDTPSSVKSLEEEIPSQTGEAKSSAQKLKPRGETREGARISGDRKQISKEAAEVLLEDYRREEELMAGVKGGRKKGHTPEIDKDW